jgi:hypothetical protein
MKSFINITGKKEGKTYNEAVILVSPTAGEFRITPLIAKQLELADGDSALVVIDPDNTSQVYIAKGIKGELALGEDGNPVKDSRNRNTYVEGSQFGAIIREVKPGSSLLKLTAAAAWQAIGGDENFSQEFTLGEGEEGQVPTGKKDELHTTTFYPLVFKAKKDKIVKTTGEAREAVVADANQIDAFAEYEEEEEV